MTSRMPHIIAASMLALALPLSACSLRPESVPDRSRTSEATTTPDAARTPDAALEDVSFDAGDDLPPHTDISWQYGFTDDPEWVDVGDTTPGWWTFVRTDHLCIAAFRSAELTGTADMDEEEATAALIAAELSDTFGDPHGLLGEGHFVRGVPGDAQIANHQFAYSFDDYGRFIAARAFVTLDHSVTVVVTCEGTDVNAVAADVLSKNVIAVDTTASG